MSAPSVRPASAAAWWDARFVPLLLALVAIGFGLRIAQLGADVPLLLSPSNAELMDGPWYLAEAVDAAHGREADVFPTYRKAIMTALAKPTFAIFGPSLETAHGLAAVLGTLLVLLGGLVGRSAFSARAGLIAASLLAIGFVPVGYGRSTVVYGPLTTGLMLAAWPLAIGLRAVAAGSFRKGALALAGSAGLCVALAGGLKFHGALAVPAIALGAAVAVPDPRLRKRALALFALLGAVSAALLLFPPGPLASSHAYTVVHSKIRFYFGAPSPLEVVKRMARIPWTSRLALLAPSLFIVGWCAALAAFGRTPAGASAPREGDAPAGSGDGGESDAARAGRRAFLVALAGWTVLWLALLGTFKFAPTEQHIPMRHFIPLATPLALLAAWLLDEMFALRPVGRAIWWPLRYAWSVAATYWVLGAMWTTLATKLEVAISSDLYPWLGFFGILATAALPAGTLALMIAGRAGRRAALLAVSAVAPLGLLYLAPRLTPALGLPAKLDRDGLLARFGFLNGQELLEAGVALACVAVAALAVRGARRSAPEAAPETAAKATQSRRLLRIAVALGLAATLSFEGVSLYKTYASPTFTLRDANTFSRGFFAPGARIAGNWAHAFTYTHPDVTRHLPRPKLRELVEELHDDHATHLIVDGFLRPIVRGLFHKANEPLIPVAMINMRHAHHVVIYRLHGAVAAGYVPSELERELEAEIRAGRVPLEPPAEGS